MSSEDLRARLAARQFRQRILSDECSLLIPAEKLITAAERYTGYEHVNLPKDDPLLAGANAVLDRDFQTIWVRNDLPVSILYSDLAHEFGHLVLHAPRDRVDESGQAMETAGYSQDQRDERDAHRFASEFLLPVQLGKSAFLGGMASSQIANALSLPPKLVLRQLVEAFSTADLDHTVSGLELPTLDRWQRDASQAFGPAIAVGNSGTGKTTALIGRCWFLVQQMNIDPREIHVTAAIPSHADWIRQSLLTGSTHGLTYISVSTAGQMAHDILTRFSPNYDPRTYSNCEVQRSRVREALSLIKSNPIALSVVRRRFTHIVADDIDQMGDDAAELISLCAPEGGTSIWATAKWDWVPSVSSPLSNAKKWVLPCQYVQSKAISEFAHALRLQEIKKDLVNPRPEPRSADGSVTVAIASTFEEMALGVQAYFGKLKSSGYHKSEIAITTHQSDAASLLAALQSTELFQNQFTAQQHSAQLNDLASYLNLCLGEWEIPSVIRVGAFPEYNLPIKKLVNIGLEAKNIQLLSDRIRLFELEKDEPGAKILAKHLMKSVESTDPEQIALQYLFEHSNYLRLSKNTFCSIRTIINSLRASDVIQDSRTERSHGYPLRDGVSVINAATYQDRSFPVVIVADPSLSRLSESLGGSKVKPDVKLELKIVEIAAAHLLYCVVSPKPKQALSIANRIRQICSVVNVMDWTGMTIDKPKSGNRDVETDEQDSLLYRQCPRRVYYQKLLLEPSKGDVEIRSSEYPATPADAALCSNCRYALLCPAVIN